MTRLRAWLDSKFGALFLLTVVICGLAADVAILGGYVWLIKLDREPNIVIYAAGIVDGNGDSTWVGEVTVTGWGRYEIRREGE